MTIASKPSTPAPGGADGVGSERSARIRRAFVLSAIGLAAVTLAACGSSSAASNTSTTAKPSSNGAGGGTGSGSGTGGTTRPGASGTIAAINGASLEVQSPTTGQTTVSYTPTTTFDQTVASSVSAVTVGSCISAVGKPTSSSSSSTPSFGGPVTATTVSISQPTSGSCTAGFGGFGRRGGTASGTTGGAASGAPSSGGGTGSGRSGFRSRFGGNFAIASGSVTSVTGSTVDVSETNPRTNASTSVVVTLTGSTTFTERMSASSTDLAVGKCATAVGTASSTGAITANSISLSSPVSGSCSSGFGGFGRGGGGAGGPGGPPAGSAGGA